MKKAIIILAVIIAGVAVLFAQTPVESVPQQATQAFVAPDVEPSHPAEELPAEVDVVIEDTLGVDEITMTVEVGEDALIEEGRISVRMKDAKLKDVIRIFNELSNANIIVPSIEEGEVKQLIDVNLNRVEWRPALEAILDTHDLELYEKIPASQVYLIRKKTPGAAEPLDVKVFKLNYASVAGVSEMISSMIPAPGKWSVFAARNSIVVQSTPENLLEIQAIISAVDLPRQQVFIEAKFLELSDSASEKLGIDWQVLGGYDVGVRNIGGEIGYSRNRTDTITRNYDLAGNQYEDYSYNERGGSTIYERTAGTPTFTEDPNSPGSYIQTDGKPTFTEDPNNPGSYIQSWPAATTWNEQPPGMTPPSPIYPDMAPTFTEDPNNPGSFVRSDTAPTFTADPNNPGSFIRSDTAATFTADPSSTIFDRIVNAPTRLKGDNMGLTTSFGATLSADDFSVVLAALKEINGAKVVSNPKIIVANEETAQIYIGTKEPNIKQTTTQVENTAPITTYNLDPDMPYFEYGIKLDVTPTVNTEDNISVSISPSLKSLVSYKVVEGNTYPITSEKTINTLFSLQSGQTAAIGGLTKSDTRDLSRKVPILGSLPLIGRFFSYSEKSDKQTETIIFVTVGLANPANISMETGLPEQSSLAMRHIVKMKADRQIKAEELKMLEKQEAERAQQAVQKLQDLREANQKLRDKQTLLEEEVAEQEANEAAAAAKEATKEIDFLESAEPIALGDMPVEAVAVESVGRASSSAVAEAKAGQAERAAPVAEVVDPANSSPITSAASKPAETPVVETAPSIEEIIAELE